MRRLTVLLLTGLVCGLAGAAPASGAIGPADVAPHVRALADVAAANGGNRAAGLPGYDRSADYVVEQLQADGWQVTRRPVRFPYYQEHSPSVLGSARPGRDFAAVRYSAAGDATGRPRVVLSERCTRRGFRAIRRGDVAVLPFADCSLERATAVARREGAAAVLFDAGSAAYPLRATTFGSRLALPVLAVRTRVLDRIVDARRRVRVRVDATTTGRVADNVVAELPGGSPVIMAGGHLDSVPEGPGINDNASGVALLLEVAERLRAAPRRATVRLGFWTAEEYGLLGSRRYVADLSRAERRRIRGYLNFDMVGSPRAVPEIYDGSERLGRILRRALPRAGTVDQDDASDHTSFARVGIPTSGIYTGALESGPRGRGVRDRCYHRTCDGAGNVDLAVLARMARAAERALRTLAR